MKLLHITAINTLEARSGIPAVLKGLCEFQNKIDGVEVRVLSLYGRVENVNSAYFDYLGDDSFYLYVKSYMPDLVIFHDFYYFKYAPMAFILKWLKIPYVLEPHGAFGKNAIRKSRIKKLIANHTLFSILIRGCKAIIFTNEGERKDFAYKKSKVYVVPNGVYENSIEKSRGKDFNSNQSPVFYYLGRFDINHKGLDYLFDALDVLEKKGEKVYVNLYGVGSDIEVQYVNKRIDNYKILSVVNKGPIYDEKKNNELRKANILLLTSRYEGSPMTVLDALSFGNPCLVTPGTNVADDIQNNKLGWVTRLDAEAIARDVLRAKSEYMLNFEDYYYRCISYVKNNYLWQIVASQSINVYKQILNIK